MKRFNEIEKELKPFKDLLKEQKVIKEELLKIASEKADDNLKNKGFLMLIKRTISKRFNQKLFVELNSESELEKYKKESESISLTVKEA